MVVGISAMVILISFFINFVVNQQSKTVMLNNAFQITEGLAKQSIFPLLSGSKENADSAIDQVLGFQSVTKVKILTEKNELFIEKNNDNTETLTDYNKPKTTTVVIETLQYWVVSSPVKIKQEFEDSFNFDTTNTTLPSIEEEVIGYVEIHFSKLDLINAQKRITFIIFIVSGVFVLFLGVLLYLSLVKLFKPLDTLEQAMEKSEKSGEHTLVKVEGAKEIRNMAKSYNSMMNVLEKHEDKITLHRDQLEKEVEARTKELINARDSALTASRHKSEFIANISHELRTPIQSIIGYGELISEELELEGSFELLDDMDKVSNNAHRLLTMINSLLDLAKIEAGKFDVNNTELNLASLIISLNDVISPIAASNANQYTCTNQSSLGYFYADREKLEQVLINLLNNACKFTKQGQISLLISNDENTIFFEIKDTGIGLTLEQQQYVFDEFRQVDASNSRKYGGTGLGLAISQRFISLMNGYITVQSEINKGSVFTVAIPL